MKTNIGMAERGGKNFECIRVKILISHEIQKDVEIRMATKMVD